MGQSAFAAPQLGAGARVDEVDADGPAASAGVRPGDVIRAVNGVPINAYADIDPAVAAAGNRAVPVDIDRGGKHVRLKVTPRVEPDSSHKVLGISHVEIPPAPKPRWNLVNAMFGNNSQTPRQPGQAQAEPEKEGPHDLYHIMFPDRPEGADAPQQ
jgi:predicted metalloprotease with PDZ domain